MDHLKQPAPARGVPGQRALRRGQLHVLVVDDSAVVRQATSLILGQLDGITVTVAADPLIAMEKMQHRRPDVILLDIEMPRMDGLTFLRKIMSEDPIPVVICSGLAESGTEVALEAMDEGAVAVVAKPRLSVRDFLEDSAVMLEEALRGAAAARMRPRAAFGRPSYRAPAGRVAARRPPSLSVTTDKVLAIGASTGGTEALRTILEALPPESPGTVIVQHMPELFTRAFADRLNQICRIEVKEAASGDRVTEGRALIAPGNRHLVLVRSGGHYTVDVVDGSLVSRHRPSVDVLFKSVARVAGRNAVGVILTGMGSDGAEGMLDLKRAGAATIAQDEASCVVFGMPREAIARGAVDEVVPLSGVSSAALRLAARADTPVSRLSRP